MNETERDVGLNPSQAIKNSFDKIIESFDNLNQFNKEMIKNIDTSNPNEKIKMVEEREKKKNEILEKFSNIISRATSYADKINLDSWKEFDNLKPEITLFEEKLKSQISKLQSVSDILSIETLISQEPDIKKLNISCDGNWIADQNKLALETTSKINELKSSISKVNKIILGLNENIQKRILSINQKYNELIDRKISIEKEIDMINKFVNEYRLLIDKHIEQLNIKNIKNELEHRIRNIEDEINTNEIRIFEAKADLSRKRKILSQAEINDIETKIAEYENEIVKLKVKHEELQEELNEISFIKKNIFGILFGFITIIFIFVLQQKFGLNSKESQDLIKLPKVLKLNSSRCEILGQIGGGGFSNVYKIKMKKGIGKKYDEIFAFKQFNISSSLIKEEEKKVIEKEIELLSQLKHDNIVKIIGVIGDPNAFDINRQRMGIGIIMEYCHNESIRSLLDKNNRSSRNELNIDLIIHLLIGAAQGLEYLHGHEPNNILHGDIKSDNILIDSEYNTKICDFGISKLIQTTIASSSTKGGGTIQYKAPEAFDNKSELKSDVYSFGCVILEMLTGDRPWKELNNDVIAIITKVRVDKGPHDLSKVRNDTPKELINLMKRCLDYDKDKRPTIKQVKMELEKMMNNAILIKLDEQTEEYKNVENRFFPGGNKEGSLNRNKYRIVKIEKIKHLFVERLYQEELNRTQSMISRLNQKESASLSSTSFNNKISTNERLLFHGTSQTNPMMILNHPDALMKDYSNDGFYGRGLYFAELARYSHDGYQYNIEGTNQYQMLVCSVICGKSKEFGQEINEGMSQRDLGTEYHSVHGGPHGLGNDQSGMYVVYKDTQVCAKYLITYE